MRAAIDRVDVVGEGEHVLRVGVVVLEGNLDRGTAFSSLDIDGARLEDLLVAVEMAHEGLQAALEVERSLAVAALVDEGDPDALGQIGRLAETLS